jgi:hypothetical protein
LKEHAATAAASTPLKRTTNYLKRGMIIFRPYATAITGPIASA